MWITLDESLTGFSLHIPTWELVCSQTIILLGESEDEIRDTEEL